MLTQQNISNDYNQLEPTTLLNSTIKQKLADIKAM